ncbi:retrotransposon protein, putative, ty1-copia subclass [Tanacetum coccineum]|uniref:Retrotransposon protein, putative, ty1-copia subclass n=1 Tax=Tanacetum coccineum TaxID=301880 RepID=A0ABQ5FYN4_9ASTR
MKWYRNLRIVLSTEDKLPFLEQPIPTLPVPPAGQVIPPDVVTTHQAWVKAQKEIVGLMLMTMDLDIQKNLEHLGANDMLKELKTFYIENLERLGHAMTQNLSVSLILVSLRKEYDSFVQNYNMHSMGKTVTELHVMLKLYEQTMPPKEVAPALHAIRVGGIQKNQKKKSHKAAKGNHRKCKAKMVYAPVQMPTFAPKPKNPPTPKKDNPTKDTICHQCGEVGHWRRNCLIYLVELMKKKQLSQGASTSGIFTIELYSFPSTSWVYDTGYGTHICITTQGLRGSRKLKPGALSLYVGDGHRASVEAIGEFHLCLPSRLVLILHNCHYAPSITRGIISVSLLYKDGFVNRFENDNSIFVSRNNLIYFNVIPRDNIYEIVMSSSVINDSSIFTVSNKRAKLNLDSALLWHYRLGHINKKRIEKLQHDGLLNSTDIKSFEKCVACMSGKMARNPYSRQVERAKDLLGLINTDEVENQLGKTIKSLRSDRGGEYMSQEFLDHLRDHGIITHRTPLYTSQHNGMSERRNRTLLDMVWSMISQTTLPKSFWDYSIESDARILNIVPTKKVDKTPYEIWHGQAPKLSYLKVWGYPKETMGYSFYYPPENKVFVARNAEFLENGLINQEASGSLEDLEIIQEEDTHPSLDTSLNHEEDDQEIYEPQSDINPIRRSTRTRRPTDRLCLYVNAEEHELGDLGELANYKAALLDPESDKWLNAINAEMQSMKDNKVWELVDLPPDEKTVGHKWLFKKKTDMDGAVHTYKARLVAKGFTQTLGINYEETFSPVSNIRAIRILIAIVAYYDYKIWQMDVKTAFLNEYLNKEVYMEQPEGFVSQKYPNRVCKLKRSIYGLKQASRQWNKRFDDEIKKFGFSQNRDEPCVYVKASGSYVTFLILYVDDILIMGNNIPMLQDVKSYLGRCFAMKDLGEAAYILGIKIYRDRSKRLIGLCQSAYIEKILKRYYMENSKRGTIPMQEKLKFSKSQGASTPAEIQRMQNIPYASAVGSIMYAVRCTRPDVAFAHNITSRFQHNPGDAHWTTVKNILKYLRNTKDMFLVYGGKAQSKGCMDSKILFGVGVVSTIDDPINMYCDNTGAITIAKDHGVTKGARYFRAKVYYLQKTIEMGDVKIEKVDTDDNLVDLFTKALAFS